MPPHPSKEETDDGALPLPPPPPPPPPPEEDAPALRFGTGLNNNNNNNNNNTNFNNNNNNNNEKEENKAKKLSEDGSWQCDSCSNTNFAWRKTCKRCDLPKSQKVKDEEKKAAAGWLLDGVDDPTNNQFSSKDSTQRRRLRTI